MRMARNRDLDRLDTARTFSMVTGPYRSAATYSGVVTVARR